MLPLALQYGMSMHEFWHEDKQLFKTYRKAYYNRLSEQCWLSGLYVDMALNNLAGNIFKEKGQKPLEYPNQPIDILKQNEKKITQDNVEENFRQLMINNTNWLKSRHNKG